MTEGKWGVIVHVSSLGQLGEQAEVMRNEREKGCVNVWEKPKSIM